MATQGNSKSEGTQSTQLFEQINSPGCYVSQQSGSLYRIPEDALIQGRSPALVVVSNEPQVVTKITSDPFLPLTKARLLAADFDLSVNF